MIEILENKIQLKFKFNFESLKDITFTEKVLQLGPIILGSGH